jgi:phosphatidylglycerophosphate synthase
MRKILTIPNLLCLFRILCAIVFLLAFRFRDADRLFLSSVLFFGGASDFLDGFLARKLDQVSDVGKILDPVADKIFMNASLWAIYLYVTDCVFFLAFCVAIKDFILVTGSLLCFCPQKRQLPQDEEYSLLSEKSLLLQGQGNLSPILISKVCTALIFCFCICSLFLQDGVISFLSYVLSGMAILVGLLYACRFYRIVKAY